ncbi:MAG: ABC transporter ATP-binding protein [Burkholderiaceae bacterium]
MKPVLRLDGVSKAFGAIRVANELCLSLAPDEALGVLGPNGAGKSSMFNLVTGDLRPDSGRVFLDGRDVTGEDPAIRCRLGIARSYQVPKPFGGMTVFENLLVGATFGADLADRAAIDHCLQVLERTGLIGRMNQLAGTLTLLDRKRLELAKALATRPRVLLLDEIAGGLTDQEAKALVATIREIRAQGVAIIWIEHVVHALLAVVDRLIVINFGSLLAEGEPDAVMASDDVRQVYMGIDA